MINELDDVLDDFIGGNAKVYWRRIESINKALYGSRRQLLVLFIFRPDDVVDVQAGVKVCLQQLLVVEVQIVVELGELEDDFDDFGLIVAAQTTVLPPGENPLTALVSESRTDWVPARVPTAVETLHPREQSNSPMLACRKVAC